MTKERLEELIKQGGEVYDSVKDKLIKLDEKTCHLVMSYPSKVIDMLEIEYKVDKYEEYHYVDYYIANLTDDTNDIERAKNDIERLNWERKTYTERTERFEPPMWEEIGKEYEFNFLYRQVVRPGLYFVRHIRFAVYLYDNLNQICIYDVDDVDFEKKFKRKATKENYEKACEIVRDLFKGGKQLWN